MEVKGTFRLCWCVCLSSSRREAEHRVKLEGSETSGQHAAGAAASALLPGGQPLLLS